MFFLFILIVLYLNTLKNVIFVAGLLVVFLILKFCLNCGGSLEAAAWSPLTLAERQNKL